MTTKISEAKFEALKSKLRELFELDKSDLDFGIYRIMAAKNKEVTAFLDRHLRESVREVLESRGSDESTKIAGEIAKAREAAVAAGFNPDDSPKVKELEEQYAKFGGGSTEELEADIYNHLLNFFSRYYDEGDFISKRFYKGDTYAIPYSGEEVTLHWANKDQHYIKSGEWHKDYRFRIEDKSVHFRLVEAKDGTGNNKEADDSKRRYILALENPIQVDDSKETITLRFEFRVPSSEDELRIESSEATRIFGGNYDKPSGRTKGDQRDGFCADSEKRAINAMPLDWKQLTQRLAPTPSKPQRTVLGKHLDHFTARNSFDYFIHRNLGKFLSNELDFYLKNEAIRLDDLEAMKDDHLRRFQSKLLAIRRIGTVVIDFLNNIERFQRSLWLKKKFVIDTHWIVSAGLLEDHLLQDVSKSDSFWRELENLGVRPATNDADEAVLLSAWGTFEYLRESQFLPVDTRYITTSSREEILASLEATEATESSDLFSALLVNGENAHALRLLQPVKRGQIGCIYIDPPYNTGKDGFLYKDEFRHSTWLSMIEERLQCCHQLLCDSGVILVSIDDRELHRLVAALDRVFGAKNHVATLVWNSEGHSDNQFDIKDDHEYVVVYSKTDSPQIGHVIDPNTREESNLWQGFAENSITKNGPGNPPSFVDLPVGFPATVQELLLPKSAVSDEFFTAVKSRGYITRESTRKFDVVYPVRLNELRVENGMLAEPCRVFSGWANLRKLQRFIDNGCKPIAEEDGELRFYLSDRGVIYYRKERSRARNIISVLKNMGTTEQMRSQLESMGLTFQYPKPAKLISYLLRIGADEPTEILDFFAGSGTTGQATIDLHRGGLSHRLSLVEGGSHFWSVVVPRIKKLMFSSNWVSGNATDNHGVLSCVKYHALESYEDALNNLPSPDGKLFEAMDQATRDSLITYSLDLELGPHLLNMDAFRDPWGYKIYAQLAGEDEVSLHNVDMVETFNYLIGLKVQSYGPIERYSADFVRLPHGDGKDAKGTPLPDDKREGRLRVEGRLRRDAEGPFVYQRIEGELNDGNATRVLVIWRKLTDNAEKDAAVLEAWMARHRESTKERSDYREYHLIYLNGPITLPQPTQDLRTVLPTEQTFKDRMFEDTEV